MPDEPGHGLDLTWPEGMGPPEHDAGEVEGERRIVSIMGGSDRRGGWRLAERCHVINFMGGADIDLSRVHLPAGTAELRITSIMGGSTVFVPETMNVRVTETAIMGGNSVRLDDPSPNPGGPVVHLRIFSLMGGTNVRRPKRSWRERLRLKQGR